MVIAACHIIIIIICTYVPGGFYVGAVGLMAPRSDDARAAKSVQRRRSLSPMAADLTDELPSVLALIRCYLWAWLVTYCA